MAGIGTAGALTLSVVCAVSLIVCNKYLLSVSHFNFATTLSGLHMITTFLWLFSAQHLRLFDQKPCKWHVALGFGVLNGFSVAVLNASLGFNTVGFYQMTKLAIIPCTALLQATFFGAKFSWKVSASLVILLVGVGIATVSDVAFNAMGAAISVAAVLSTAFAQILTSTIAKGHNLSSTQLLYACSPYQAVSLVAYGPPLDYLLTGKSLLAFQYTTATIVLIAVSCLIAVSVNFSNFLVIGKTSPVSFQVLGHLKTCLILAMGYLVFGDPFRWRNVIGVSIALVGMVAYSYLKVTEDKPNHKNEPMTSKPLLSKQAP